MKKFLTLCACALVVTASFGKKTVDVQAHRGGMGLTPENTIPGFLNCIDMGVNTLELDVVISKDGKVVISHDSYMNPAFTLDPQGKEMDPKNKKIYLYGMTYDSIRKYDVGSKYYDKFPTQKKMKVSKPLLADMFAQVEKYAKSKKAKPCYNIETKINEKGEGVQTPPVAEFVATMMKVIDDAKVADRVTIQSFDVRSLQILKKQYPQIKSLAYLVSDKQPDIDLNIQKLGFVPEIYSPNYQLVTPEMVAKCKQMNMKLLPWTPDEVQDLQKLVDMGVWGIITNYPDRLLKIVK